MESLATTDLLHQVGALSYIGMFFGAIGANMLPGFPEEFFVIIIGYFIGNGTFSFWRVMLAVIPALIISDNILYISSRAGSKFTNKLARKIFGDKLDSLANLPEYKVIIFLIASRFVFQVRFLGPFLSGTTKMPWKKFFLIDICALLIYVTTMIGVGSYFQNRIERILLGFHSVGNIIGIIMAIVILGGAFVFFRKKIWSAITRIARGETSFFGISRTEE